MLTPNRIIPPGIEMVDKVNYLKPDAHKLSNGMPVYFLNGSAHEVLKLEFVFNAGSYHQKKSLVAYCVANLLNSGTKNKTSEEINYIWDFYGAYLQVDAQKDIISITVFCIARHIIPVLDLLTEIISQATFPQEELDIFLNNLLQKHIVNKKKVEHIARLHFTGLLYGFEHPYGKHVTDDDFKNVNREDLLDYFHKFIHPGNAVCIIAGKYPEQMMQILEKTLQQYTWNVTSNSHFHYPEPETVVTPKHKILKEDALQSSLRIGKHMINRQQPDYHKVEITNALLGGYFGSRLMQNIRQDKGYTYGINSAVVTLLKSSYFFISTQVGKDVCNKAITEIYRELKNLRTQPADDYEISMLRNYLSASLLRSFDGPFQQADRFKEMMLFGLDYSYFDNYINTLTSFTAQDIQEMAEKYFHEKDMIELVVG